jgi:hypothetical protein
MMGQLPQGFMTGDLRAENDAEGLIAHLVVMSEKEPISPAFKHLVDCAVERLQRTIANAKD